MTFLIGHPATVTTWQSLEPKPGERGAALAITILMLGLLGAIALGVLAVTAGNSRIAGSDLKRTQACYASAAAIERMTNDFSALFAHTSRPSTAQLHNIELTYPPELTAEGYSFPDHTIVLNSAALAAMGTNTAVTIPYGPFGGLIANLKPYTLTTNAQSSIAQCKLLRDMNNYLIPLFQFGMFSDEDIEVHPGPPFAFNGRVHANGNIYANGDIKFLAKVTTANEFIYDVLRNGSTRTGNNVSIQAGSINVAVSKGSMNLGPRLPAATASPAGQRGYFPGSPYGTINSSWNSTSVAAAVSGTANQFGGQLLTRTTGAAPLKLPLQLDGSPTREIIKRRMPNDSPNPATPSALSDSRYHSKAQIRILIDDEAPSTTDAAGIPAGQGVFLSTFDPVSLPSSTPSSSPTVNGGGRALWRVNDNNTSVSNSYGETSTSFVQQQQNGTAVQADTVRGVKAGPALKAITGATNANPIKITCTAHGFSTGDKVFIANVGGNTNANGGYTITKVDANNFTLNSRSGNSSYTSSTGTVYSFTTLPKSANGAAIPSGSGLTGHILIQIIDTNGVAWDVTTQVLSMGMTEGEPNAIVMLQRPLWAAFAQGSRDASTASPTPNPALNGDPGYSNTLTDILNKTHLGADGEIMVDATHPVQDISYGYLTKIMDDTASGSQAVRPDVGTTMNVADWGTSTWNTNKEWNAMVPINVYNVREGRINSSLSATTVYERGVTSIVELNMRNLARWVDGVFDLNLLANTNAVSTNVASPDGYTLYISDRRGDRVKSMLDSGVTVNATNGMVDNEDIYGPNGILDAGEDVQNTGALVKDTNELPDPAAIAGAYGVDINKRALTVSGWVNSIGGAGADRNNSKYFRNAVRLFNGENLQVSGSSGKLSTIKGLTVSTENMVYIWGNYNTTGINSAPPDGTSSLNDNTTTYYYLGNQVPTSIVADAFFPLSKTFFDSETSLYPDDLSKRPADSSPSVAQETAVRTAIIAGNNLSALFATPDAGNSASGESRLSGGMHNFPRFLERWSLRWNFVGSLVPLYHSTQALGPYNADSTIYGAPIRNWAFDTTFLQMDRLPPGTPMFQYISPTAFRQEL